MRQQRKKSPVFIISKRQKVSGITVGLLIAIHSDFTKNPKKL